MDLEELPHELLSAVFGMCDTKTLVFLTRTCWFFHDFVHGTFYRKKEYPPHGARVPVVDFMRRQNLVEHDGLPEVPENVVAFVKKHSEPARFETGWIGTDEERLRKRGLWTVRFEGTFGIVHDGTVLPSSRFKFDIHQKRSSLADKRVRHLFPSDAKGPKRFLTTKYSFDHYFVMLTCVDETDFPVREDEGLIRGRCRPAHILVKNTLKRGRDCGKTVVDAMLGERFNVTVDRWCGYMYHFDSHDAAFHPSYAL